MAITRCTVFPRRSSRTKEQADRHQPATSAPHSFSLTLPQIPPLASLPNADSGESRAGVMLCLPNPVFTDNRNKQQHTM
ncbi:hypothetical protein E2C01_022869 [Portunus trituberculatus]|uniref:Uncharacterized protein n=1 Tax=Portunus trituberculatus TaxID=210409 RepID=A0A5B7E7B4_PORTR|nr:hypothetical protein [Portunus trituberculatus]